MPSSNSFRRLAWKLYSYFVEAPQFNLARLIEAGWYDLLNVDSVSDEAADPVDVALEVFTYLQIDSDGKWANLLFVTMGVVAFLDDQIDVIPSSSQLRDLAQVTRKNPIVQQEIADWFKTVYG